jgi:serine/threonine protein kinase
MALHLAPQTEPAGEDTALSGAGRMPSPAPDEIAQHFPHLDILECLGRGGMGVVYKARQKPLHRLVGLKILAPEKSTNASFAARFQREAEALAKLNHPGIVTLYEFGRVPCNPSAERANELEAAAASKRAAPLTASGSIYFFLMEFVDGVSLRQLLEAGRIAPREALAIVPQICDALQYAHDQGIVHRDIKPENILLDRHGRVKVADFGLAKLGGIEGTDAAHVRVSSSDITPQESSSEFAVPPDLTEAGKVMGTPPYMAPEQRERPTEVDHRADIYALGVVLYQMLTGELPGPRLDPPSSKVQIDVRLDEVVLRALEKKPERRYAQASALKTQLETIAATARVVTHLGASAQLAGRDPRENQTYPKSPVASSLQRISPAALVGTAWIGLFFLNYVVSYTPLGWSLKRFWRKTSLDWLVELLFFLPLMILGCASLLGSPAMGVVALRQIRQAAGGMRGLGLALFDVLFFPLVLLNGWACWLAWTVIVHRPQLPILRQHSSGIVWAMTAVALLGVAMNVLLIRRALRKASVFVNSPPPPQRPLVIGSWGQALRGSIIRFGLVLVLHLALFETLEQRSVDWRESTSELWGMALAVATLGGLIWAFWPGYRLKRSWLFCAAGTIASSFLVLAVVNYYSWHLRPNLGLYREPRWVAQHPGFQKELRQRIESNLWQKPAADSTRVATASRAPFIARLPQGSMELLAVSYYPWTNSLENQPWWRPDGVLWPTPELGFVTSGPGMERNATSRTRQFVLRGEGMPEGTSWPELKVENAYTWAWGEVRTMRRGIDPSCRVITVSPYATNALVDLRIGVALSPWQTLATGIPTESTSHHLGDIANGVVSFTIGSEVDGRALVTAAHNVFDREVRIVAMDDAGIPHDPTRQSTSSIDRLSHTTSQFHELPLSRVKTFEFQMRSFHWVEFRHVTMEPGHRSSVEVVHAQASDGTVSTNQNR